MAGKGKRGVRDDARVWSPRDWNNSVAMEREKKSGVLKEVEFNLGYIEVRVLARN